MVSGDPECGWSAIDGLGFNDLTYPTANLRQTLYRGGIAEETLAVRP
jgi:hypothetical protein